MAVSSAGVGAIYELRVSSDSLESVMVAGLDYWNPANMPTIVERQLARNLHIDHFKGMPSVPENRHGTDVFYVDTKSDAYLPTFRFPIWLECKKCHRLGTEERKYFVSKRGQQPTCTDGECGGKGLPVRLVLSCQDSLDSDGGHPGHLDEFPWKWWAHSDPAGKARQCDGGDLFLDGVKGSITLAGLRVRCDGCGSQRSLKDVFRSKLPQFFGCSGRRPWLNDTEDCGKAVVPLMRGASNVYFPVVASAIEIPPFSRRLVDLIRNHKSILDQIGSFETSVLVTMVKNTIPVSQDYPDVEIEEAIWSAAGSNDDLVARSDAEQRAAEHNAIVQGRGSLGDNFIAVVVNLEETDLDRFVGRIVKVPALREVRALRGFNRVQRAEQSDPNNVACAPLAKDRQEWLPAIEVRGEGVYIELDSARVLAWQTSDAVRKRWLNISNNVRKACGQDNKVFQEDTFPSAGGILVHTFAHLLINQLTLDCGYSTASLRERLYVGEDGTDVFFGFLIYTGTHGADGTLGGLVSQGDPLKMEAAIKAALEKAVWCASDPVCMESTGQGPNATNMAACHACCIVSETSCEKGNQFLDRGLLVGVIGEPGIGFFENPDRW